MPPDLLLARSLGFVLLRENLPDEGARLDPPFLLYDPAWDPEKRAVIVRRLLAEADERVTRGVAPLGSAQAPAGRKP